MPDIPTRADLFRVGVDEILARSKGRPPSQRISEAALFTEGSELNLFLAAASAMAEEVVRQTALQLAARALDSAEGEELDQTAAELTNGEIVRKGASPAAGSVQLSRSGGPLAAITVGRGQIVEAEGVEFETLAPVSFTAGQTGPLSVDVEAVEAGPVGNVEAFAITRLVDPPDPNLTVTNPERLAGGDVTESDARLKERVRQWFRSLRRGTIEAIELAALSVAGVRQATGTELRDENGEINGRVELTIVDTTGRANTTLATRVDAALFDARAAGNPVDVLSGSPVFVDIRYRLRFESGVDTSAAFRSVQRTALARVNALRPGEVLTEASLLEAARSVPGVIVRDDALVAPVGDIVPDRGEVLRTTAARITAV